MNTLLLVGLGPVQEFIERARRTRDLWFGSHVLSEMSRAVARSLAGNGWQLVFPAFPPGSPDLAHCDGMWTQRDSGPVRPLAVVNKVLAIRCDTDEETTILHAAAARQEAIGAWRRFADRAVKNAGGLLREGLPVEHRPQNVIEDLLEIVAAWSTYASSQEYNSAREAVEAQLSSRKLLRDFQPWTGAERPKSSLDGFRETVLVERGGDGELPGNARLAARDFRVGKAEHLDGVGLVKRTGGDPQQFVPIATVALGPWIQAIRERVSRAGPASELGARFRDLVGACRDFDVPQCDARAASWLGEMRYDAEIFLEGRWPTLDFGRKSRHTEEEEKSFGRRYVEPLLRALGRGASPNPYVACLVADGDRMGRALSKVGSIDPQADPSVPQLDPVERHAGLSRRLAEFARGARAVVEKHHGVLVYSGGDDILAFLPVHTAVGCADALETSFQDALRPVFTDPADVPTLSIGLGIGHLLSPLGELLALGRKAEKYAKHGDGLPDGESRRALAVIVEKRTGNVRRWRCRWEDGPHETLRTLVNLLVSREIPGGLAHELEHARSRFPDPEELRTDLFWAGALARDVGAVLRRKQPDTAGTSGLTLERIGLRLDPAEGYEKVAAALDAWVERALIARVLADSRQPIDHLLTEEA